MCASALANKELTARLPLILLCITTIAWLYVHFERIFKCPSCYLFSDGGDGLKNYFTAAYYVQHDKGLWFTGMNYPYGEHPVYTDNQPVWSLLMKLIDMVFPMQQHVIGTMNMLLVLSLGVAVIATYFVLRAFQLPGWYAALASLPVVFLSPQIARFSGHYSLAYVCYLPLFVLGLIKWQSHGFNWRGGIGLLVLIVWMGFTHLYFFFIAAAFLISYALVLWIKNAFRWQVSHTKLIALAIVAGMAVYLPVKLTDPITDRPREVYGMYVFAAKPSGTFLPWYGTWEKTWKEEYQMPVPDTESRSWIGIAGLILGPWILIYGVLHLVSRRRRSEMIAQKAPSPGAIAWAGLLVWVMATGWFYMAGGSVLVETFPVLGQFRSLGRLAWIFYFTWNCFAVWLLWQGLAQMRHRRIRYVAGILAAMLWFVWCCDAYAYTVSFTQHLYRHNNVFRGGKPFLQVLENRGLKPDDFQAILQLPVTIIGTESLPVHRGHWGLNTTMQCAWETGLPIVNFNMSRTSVSHALSLLQLISTPDIPKLRLQDMDQRPLLLTSYDAHRLPTELRLVALADSLGRAENMDLYRLDLSVFTSPPMMDSVQWEILLLEDFENSPADHTFWGSGAHRSQAHVPYLTYTSTTHAGTELWFTCQVYIASTVPGFPATRVVQYAPDGTQIDEQVHSIHSFDPWQVRGHWVEVTFPLHPKVESARFEFSVFTGDALIDAVVIRHAVQ